MPHSIARAPSSGFAAALTALDEPFRTTVIRRYLDGQSAADIAKALGIPAGTVRWRLTKDSRGYAPPWIEASRAGSARSFPLQELVS